LRQFPKELKKKQVVFVTEGAWDVSEKQAGFHREIRRGELGVAETPKECGLRKKGDSYFVARKTAFPSSSLPAL